jgi:hypothetical protein
VRARGTRSQQERKRSAPRQRSDIFHSIFPFSNAAPAVRQWKLALKTETALGLVSDDILAHE